MDSNLAIDAEKGIIVPDCLQISCWRPIQKGVQDDLSAFMEAVKDKLDECVLVGFGVDVVSCLAAKVADGVLYDGTIHYRVKSYQQWMKSEAKGQVRARSMVLRS
jgi:tryptophan synthase alpha subunit